MFHINSRGALYRTLKLLDVRENGIAVSVPQEVVAAIEARLLRNCCWKVRPIFLSPFYH